MVYGVFSQAERGQSEKGLADTLEAAGLTVDRLEITQEANSDPSLAVPVLVSYIQSHPDLKAIGTQHGGITGVLAEVLQKAGKQPGDILVGGIDLGPATIDGLKSGYISATLDQLLYLQGFMPVVQCVMTAKYKMPGLSLNTGAGVVTPDTIDDLVELIDQGIVVTVGNSPMTDLQAEFGVKGLGYAGVDLFAGGKLTAEQMIEKGGLKAGDKAMVYGVFSQAERGLSEKGLAETLEKAGLTVERLEITQEANSDASLAVPVLAAYVQNNPDLKAIGTQHGGITGILAEVLKKAGKKPGEITVGGIDLGPATIDGLKSGYVQLTLDQLLYMQGFLPVLQCVLTAKYKMPGLNVNTGAGVVTSETITDLVSLIDAGIR